MTIKERLEVLKAKTGWSDADLAARLEVSAPAVTRWRSGTKPRPDVLKRLDALERNPLGLSVETAERPLREHLDSRLDSLGLQLTRIEGILLGQRTPWTVDQPTELGAGMVNQHEAQARAKRK